MGSLGTDRKVGVGLEDVRGGGKGWDWEQDSMGVKVVIGSWSGKETVGKWA